MPEQSDQQWTVDPSWFEERAEDVLERRHRRVVHDERPPPALPHPQPAVALPQSPQGRQHEYEQDCALEPAAHGHTPGLWPFERDRGHRAMLTTLTAGKVRVA